MTQKDRILAALYRAGKFGISQIDFDLPDVIDGGTPIKRVAARIEELRDQGFAIRSGERRAKCVVYRIESGGHQNERPATSEPASDNGGALELFGDRPRLAIFDEDVAA